MINSCEFQDVVAKQHLVCERARILLIRVGGCRAGGNRGRKKERMKDERREEKSKP